MNTDTRISELKAELARLEEQRIDEVYAAAGVDRGIADLADLLHEKTCHSNHADGCGWHYEGYDRYIQKGSTRSRYYNKVKGMFTVRGATATIIRGVIEFL